MAEKNSFVLQTRLNAIVAKLSDKQAGTLFKGILNYAKNGVKATFEDGMVDIVFEMVKQDIDYNANKYAETCAKRAMAGGLGGRPKKANESKKSKCFLEKAKKANGFFEKHNDIDIDVDNDIKEKEIKEKEKPISSNRFIKPTVEQIKSYCLERNNKVDAQRFFDFYESKGWKVGSNTMKDWKAAVRTWEHSTTEKKQSEREIWRMPSPAGKYDV